MSESAAWERQSGESAKAFGARRTYLHMGPDRSLAKVCQEEGKSRAVVERWSVKWKWVVSAKLFDTYNDEIASKAVSERNVADAIALRERWAKRDDEQLNGDYLTWAYFFSLLAEVQSGKKKATTSYLDMIGRNLARLSPIATAAREEAGRRLAGARGTDVPGGPMSGRAVATIRAFNEFEGDGRSAIMPGRRLVTLKAFVDYKEADEPEAG